DREYELDVSEPEPGVFLIRHDNEIYEAAVTVSNDGKRIVSLKGKDHEIVLYDPKRLRSSAGADAHADGVAEIKTAMPGKVVRILTAPGTPVEKGDGVIVVEAMKMQNELKSPKAGTVKEIRVEEGTTVSAGDVLATIE
ncbi:MAG TPA: biotin/lipoyl-containing protein, partial [Pyrinomonadaceae bacterium]|nr:biotin/lipoyl-containing protein [Pyrinomonadaceae bacterium]